MRRSVLICSGIALALALAARPEAPAASATEASTSVGIVQGFDRVEEQVPVGDMPQTGDAQALSALGLAGTAAGLIGLGFAAKRKDDERDGEF